MLKLKIEYQELKSQLSNAGHETNICEVMWNDGIFIAIDELFEGVPKSTQKLIKLNHI